MSSMNENLLDKIARADFSMETDFKSVLRKRLFESGANKDFLRQQEQKDKNQ